MRSLDCRPYMDADKLMFLLLGKTCYTGESRSAPSRLLVRDAHTYMSGGIITACLLVTYGLFPAIKNTKIKSVRGADSIILNSDSAGSKGDRRYRPTPTDPGVRISRTGFFKH